MTHVVIFDKTKPKPAWVCNQGLKNTGSRKYWQRVWDAQPVYADPEKIRAIYKEAARLRKLGYDVVVDHIIPLRGEHVCGFHHEDNLQIIDRVLNAQISNHIYPGAPCEQYDMFGVPLILRKPPKQRELL